MHHVRDTAARARSGRGPGRQRRARVLRFHDDAAVTNAGFIIIVFFPTFVFVMSMIQRRLEKRKEASKAAKKQLGEAEWRGGW